MMLGAVLGTLGGILFAVIAIRVIGEDWFLPQVKENPLLLMPLGLSAFLGFVVGLYFSLPA